MPRFFFFVAVLVLAVRCFAAYVDPPGTVESAIALGNLAASYRMQGRASEAQPLFDQVIEILEAQPTLPGELPRTHLHAAMVAIDLGDVTRAEEHCRLALQILEKLGATDSADAGSAHNAEGVILTTQARFHDAQQELETALALRRKWLPANHTALGETLNNLGLVYRQQGRMEESGQACRGALEIFASIAPSHGSGVAHNNMGLLLAAQGRRSEAEHEFREALAIWQGVYGTDHPDIAIALSNLSSLKRIRHRYADAETLQRRAQEIDRGFLPAGHTQIGLDLNNAGMLAAARKRYSEAEEFYRSSVEILEKNLPPDHPDTGRVLANLADVLRLEGRAKDSEPLYRRGLAILTNSWGPDDRRLLGWLESFAGMLRSQQNFADAARLDMQVMRIRVLASKHSG